MNILITGGAGYIGSHVALTFLDKGHRVTIVDNLITGTLEVVPKKAFFLKADISDSKKISNLLKENNFDLIMHFAGLVKVEESIKFPEKYKFNNIEKTKLFFETCLKFGLNKVIFSSTAGLYGQTNNHFKVSEQDSLRPLNPYAETKLEIEKHLTTNLKKKIRYTILRYFNVAGADDRQRSGYTTKNSNNLIKVVCELATSKIDKIIINGNDYDTKDGSPVRDFIHVSDLAEIHLIAAENLLKEDSSEIYNCGYGYGYSVKEVIFEMERIINHKLKFEFGPRREGDISYSVSDSQKFYKKFNWHPKHNNLNYILKSALDWEKKMR